MISLNIRIAGIKLFVLIVPWLIASSTNLFCPNLKDDGGSGAFLPTVDASFITGNTSFNGGKQKQQRQQEEKSEGHGAWQTGQHTRTTARMADAGVNLKAAAIDDLTARRPIPEKVIIGYATTCDDKVKHVIRQGVNVVIWAFFDVKRNGNANSIVGASADDTNDDTQQQATLEGSLDLECIQQLIADLDAEGYDDTLHLTAFGGWNGAHLDPSFQSAEDWYQSWKDVAGHIFHGIDWDLEGNDDLQSPYNYFSMRTLHMMGGISRLAKRDGYVVTMAPAQSYLDIQSSRFSRYVNLTDPLRTWHADFHYFGANVYAYLLAQYGDAIDLVSVQFYESYSRAALEVFHHGLIPEAYLKFYVRDHADRDERFFVEFDDDDDCDVPSQEVQLPLSKLVLGFTNVRLEGHKMIYFPIECVQAAYQDLVDQEITPRGFMYWCIEEEDVDGMDYAKDLNSVLHVRGSGVAEES